MPDTDTIVRHDVVVPVAAEVAFAAFTQRIGEFKPPEHNMLAAPIAETVFEPQVGGHIVDRDANGTECRWATVLVFDPPHRVVFSWNISPRWEVISDPEQTSEVEVSFVALGDDRTRVELEHRRLERHGSGWESVRDGVDGADGWPRYLARFRALFGDEA